MCVYVYVRYMCVCVCVCVVCVCVCVYICACVCACVYVWSELHPDKPIIGRMNKGKQIEHMRRLDVARQRMLKARSRRTQRAQRLFHDKLSNTIKTAVTSFRMQLNKDLHSTWLHVDMDMFYAAVAIRDNPKLKGKPVAVGGMAMISTSNYEARKYGVRSAMPGFIAMKLCPSLIFVRSDFAKYKAIAVQIRTIFSKYDPHFEAVSLDEAYLNITKYIANVNNNNNNSNINNSSTNNSDNNLNDDNGNNSNHNHAVNGEIVAQEIRAAIFNTTHLTASAGIACNRMLSKICSDMNKPNGQFCLPSNHEAIHEFLFTLPVRKVPGIGKVMERTLHSLGIHTCGDILKIDSAITIYEYFSQRTSAWLLSKALGISSSYSDGFSKSSVNKRKSISVERTFRAASALVELENYIKKLSVALFKHVQKQRGKGKTITLKMKTTAFHVRSRSLTLDRHISSLHDITHLICSTSIA